MSRSALLVLPLLALSSCTWVSDADLETRLGTDSALPTLTLTSLTPRYGTNAGGLSVTLTGAGFDDATVVSFGDTAATIDSVQQTQIVVTTPPYDGDGSVDVTVSRGPETSSLPQAYDYYPDALGLVGAVGFLGYTRVLGALSTAWGVTDSMSAAIGFIEPASVTPGAWHLGLAMDGCVDLADAQTLDLAYLSEDAATLDLTPSSGGAPISLPLDRKIFTKTGISADPLAPSYALSEFSREDWPTLDIEDFVAMPPAFNLVSPSFEGDAVPTLPVNSLELEWDGDPASYGLLYLTLYDSTQTQKDQAVCLLQDDGSFVVPRDLWTETCGSSDYYTVFLMRVRLPGTSLPTDRSTVFVEGIYGLLGAARCG